MGNERIYDYELKTTERLQDEPWYGDFQCVCEVMCAGPELDKYWEHEENGLQLALNACKEYFIKYPGPLGHQIPSDERLIRWIQSTWLTEEMINKIEKLRRVG